MLLSPGTRLGPYEVVAALGAGGMGEVYRSRDTRLDRTVALKILSPELADDPAFRSRFEREARTISSLNHPHICTLHDIGRQGGVDYLVMEYLEGQTLADRMGTEVAGLKLAEALRIAIDIADAVDTAHRHHVVHRDLKPGNIMLTSGGAKLLDVGLAKQPAGGDAAALSMLATRPGSGTAEGTIVGTLQYMAPEQIQGREADARTDTFALGAVIYKMVTGRKAFQGGTQASVMAKILETDPALPSAVAAVSPPQLDHIVMRCLAKEPEDRWQSARDVLLELRWVQGGRGGGPCGPGTRAGPTSVDPLGRDRRSVGGGDRLDRAPACDRRASPGRSFRSVTGPEHVTRRLAGLADPVARRSPDGRLIVVTGTLDGRQQLLVRRLEEASFRALPGTEGARRPFFSPSGRSLAFVANRRLRRVEVSGGPVVVLSEVAAVTGGAWSRDGVILFGQVGTGLFRIAESGENPEPVTTLDAARGDTAHESPQFLPDSRTFLCTVSGRHGGIYAGSLDSTILTPVLSESGRAYFVELGFIVFSRLQTLMAVPFDVRGRKVSGPAFPIVRGLFSNQFSATANGHLAYRAEGDNATQLSWYDRDSRRLAVSELQDPTGRSPCPRADGAWRFNAVNRPPRASRQTSG